MYDVHANSYCKPIHPSRFYDQVMLTDKFIWDFIHQIDWYTFVTKNSHDPKYDLKHKIVDMFYDYIKIESKKYTYKVVIDPLVHYWLYDNNWPEKMEYYLHYVDTARNRIIYADTCIKTPAYLLFEQQEEAQWLVKLASPNRIGVVLTYEDSNLFSVHIECCKVKLFRTFFRL